MSAKLGLDLLSPSSVYPSVLQWTHIADCTRFLEREGRTDDRGNSPSPSASLSPFHYPPSVLLCFTTTFFAGGRRATVYRGKNWHTSCKFGIKN